MIDVSSKFCTLRYARAEGFLYGSPATLQRVADNAVPKGDVAEVARAAGIHAAKRCADWITFCHPIPLDLVEVSLAVIDRSVPGIVEAIRSHGRNRTPYAMLSRGEAGVRGSSVIINLPGSAKGSLESLQALFPGLLHIFPMLEGGGHTASDSQEGGEG